jgi:hypothetical protein
VATACFEQVNGYFGVGDIAHRAMRTCMIGVTLIVDPFVRELLGEQRIVPDPESFIAKAPSRQAGYRAYRGCCRRLNRLERHLPGEDGPACVQGFFGYRVSAAQLSRSVNLESFQRSTVGLPLLISTFDIF